MSILSFTGETRSYLAAPSLVAPRQRRLPLCYTRPAVIAPDEPELSLKEVAAGFAALVGTFGLAVMCSALV